MTEGYSHDFDPVTWEALHTRFAAEDNQLTTYEHPDQNSAGIEHYALTGIGSGASEVH